MRNNPDDHCSPPPPACCGAASPAPLLLRWSCGIPLLHVTSGRDDRRFAIFRKSPDLMHSCPWFGARRRFAAGSRAADLFAPAAGAAAIALGAVGVARARRLRPLADPTHAFIGDAHRAGRTVRIGLA